jgi:hypothetical protein
MTANSNGITTELQKGNCSLSIGTEDNHSPSESNIINTIYSTGKKSKYSINLNSIITKNTTDTDIEKYISNLTVGYNSLGYDVSVKTTKTENNETKTETTKYGSLSFTKDSVSNYSKLNIVTDNLNIVSNSISDGGKNYTYGLKINNANDGIVKLYQQYKYNNSTKETYLELDNTTAGDSGFILNHEDNYIISSKQENQQFPTPSNYSKAGLTLAGNIKSAVKINPNLWVNGCGFFSGAMVKEECSGTSQVSSDANYNKYGIYSQEAIRTFKSVYADNFKFNFKRNPDNRDQGGCNRSTYDDRTTSEYLTDFLEDIYNQLDILFNRTNNLNETLKSHTHPINNFKVSLNKNGSTEYTHLLYSSSNSIPTHDGKYFKTKLSADSDTDGWTGGGSVLSSLGMDYQTIEIPIYTLSANSGSIGSSNVTAW